MTTTPYTQNQLADAVEYLCTATTAQQDQKELLELQRALRGIPEVEHEENLTLNATEWAKVVERNLHLCLPEHRERLEQLIENLRAHPGL